MTDNYQDPPASGSTIFLNIEYVKSLDSVCKIIEMVLGLCTFICACVWGTWRGGGWVQFVGIFAFIVIGIIFVVKLINLIHYVPSSVPVVLVELGICGMFILFFFIAGIVAAVVGQWAPAIAAASVFSFFSMVAFGADAFIKFQEWRSDGGTLSFGPSQSSTTTTTTTTATVTMSNEVDPKY